MGRQVQIWIKGRGRGLSNNIKSKFVSRFSTMQS